MPVLEIGTEHWVGGPRRHISIVYIETVAKKCQKVFCYYINLANVRNFSNV